MTTRSVFFHFPGFGSASIELVSAPGATPGTVRSRAQHRQPLATEGMVLFEVRADTRPTQAIDTRERLEPTDLPIKEIAWELGSDFLSTFSAVFARRCDVPPATQRRRTHG